MPRAKGHIDQLHDRAAEVRSRISLLEDELEELKTTGPVLPVEPEPSLKDEEQSVVRFEAQLAASRRKVSHSVFPCLRLINLIWLVARRPPRPAPVQKTRPHATKHRPHNLHSHRRSPHTHPPRRSRQNLQPLPPAHPRPRRDDQHRRAPIRHVRIPRGRTAARVG
jgi:hypothetical protein